ncbi:MAG: hypothetical protein AAFY26_09635 [Cyanobacteria bacterium J06638_22]
MSGFSLCGACGLGDRPTTTTAPTCTRLSPTRSISSYRPLSRVLKVVLSKTSKSSHVKDKD